MHALYAVALVVVGTMALFATVALSVALYAALGWMLVVFFLWQGNFVNAGIAAAIWVWWVRDMRLRLGNQHDGSGWRRSG